MSERTPHTLVLMMSMYDSNPWIIEYIDDNNLSIYSNFSIVRSNGPPDMDALDCKTREMFYRKKNIYRGLNQ
jgi:hypothetical protein